MMAFFPTMTVTFIGRCVELSYGLEFLFTRIDITLFLSNDDNHCFLNGLFYLFYRSFVLHGAEILRCSQ
jgi:hypothetical protein